MFLSVIIPTFQNNVSSPEIGKMFTDLGYDVQVVISTDVDPHVGKGHAIKEGLGIAVGKYTLIMDADVQIPVKELKSFLKLQEIYDADAVIGNKRHPYSNIHYSLFRRFISWGYRTLVKILFHPTFRDTQCGFKLFKTEVLKLIIDKTKSNRYTLDLELIVALKENGFRVIDAPVYVKRQVNKCSVKISSVYTMLVDTLAIWWRKQRGWYQS